MTFEEEIRESPKALERLFDYWHTDGQAAARRLSSGLVGVREVLFSGMGSSLNAAYPAKYLLARHGITVRIEPASELLYNLLGTISDETLVIAVSQSGETIETNRLLQALEDHRHLWVVVNDEASSMATSGRPCLPIKAGAETRTSSKTYTNTLALLYLLAEQIGGSTRPTSEEDRNRIIDAAVTTLSEADELARRMLDHWGRPDRLYVVARGPSLATANQFSLILAETTSALAHPVDGGTFRHGFNLSGADGPCTLVLSPESSTVELSERIAVQAAQRGSSVVVLSSNSRRPVRQMPTGDRLLALSLQPVVPDLAPLLEILTLDIFTLKLAVQEGRDPGKLDSKVTPEE